MNKLTALFGGLLLALGLATPALAANVPNLSCDTSVTGGTYKNVTVKPGDSCTLLGVTVLGNVHARDAVDVKILDTNVGHNIMVMRAIGDVVIGNRGCAYDPLAGNNLMVKDSHNVAICQMSVDNNLVVTGNDGRIGVFSNRVGNNIMVSRNDAYVGTSSHGNPDFARVRNNTVAGHIQVFSNARQVVLKNNITVKGYQCNGNTPAAIGC
ncbi:MAG: hypothetical protein H0V07_09790 [Propionibacteriales bacterium]|nr:hypothetical protein [Propionibacteriales bacterium]